MPKKIGALIGFAAIGLFVLIFSLDSYYSLKSDHVAVVQYLNGSLEVVSTPGPHFSWGGHVEEYPIQGQYWFSAATDQGAVTDQSIEVRFNDGAKANISGSMSYTLPIANSLAMIDLHRAYGSASNVEQRLIRTVTEKAVYMTGPLMSSKEAYAEKRNQLIGDIQDQVTNGVFKTYVEAIQDKDPMTGAPRTINVVRKVMLKDGTVDREDTSPLTRFGIKTFNLALNKVIFADIVENQIAAQQAATQQVQLAIAQAKEAEQQAITAAKQGEAKAATAKWEQEVIKARAVTEAEQKLEVAKLDNQQSLQYKAATINRADADAEYRRRVMAADGALTQKLEAYVKVQTAYAENIPKYAGAWVPSIVFGGAPGAGGGANLTSYNGAQSLINMLSAKTAQDLALQFPVKAPNKNEQPVQ